MRLPAGRFPQLLGRGAARPIISPGSRGWTGLRAQFGTALLALVAVMALVLIAVCANVSNLVLANATRRRDEIEVRLALGGTRARVVWQFLTEGVLLSALAAAGGIVIRRDRNIQLAWVASYV